MSNLEYRERTKLAVQIGLNRDVPENPLPTEAIAQLNALQDDAIKNGATRYPQGDQVIYEIFTEYLDLNTAKFVTTIGGDVRGMKCYIEITDKTSPVPDGVIASKSVDVEGEPVSRTWEQWAGEFHGILELGGRMFINSVAGTGYRPDLSDLLPVLDDLVHMTEVKALQDAADNT